MGRRLYSRQSNGRFRRAALENTFGLSAPSCPSCGRFNPHAVGEPPPVSCHACGAPMKPETTCPDCGCDPDDRDCPSCGNESCPCSRDPDDSEDVSQYPEPQGDDARRLLGY